MDATKYNLETLFGKVWWTMSQDPRFRPIILSRLENAYVHFAHDRSKLKYSELCPNSILGESLRKWALLYGMLNRPPQICNYSVAELGRLYNLKKCPFCSTPRAFVPRICLALYIRGIQCINPYHRLSASLPTTSADDGDSQLCAY